MCSSPRMSSGGSASGDPATHFPCWTTSLTPQVAGSHRRAFAGTGMLASRSSRSLASWATTSSTEMTRSGPDGTVDRDRATHDPSVRPEDIDAQRGVGIYELHHGLTRRIERVDVPKQKVSRQGLRYTFEGRDDEVDVVQVADRMRGPHGGSEIPRLDRRRAPSARPREALAFEAC